MVNGLIAMHLGRYKDSGAELIMGSGHFLAPKTIAVRLNDGGERVLVGERVFLNVGTHATMCPVLRSTRWRAVHVPFADGVLVQDQAARRMARILARCRKARLDGTRACCRMRSASPGRRDAHGQRAGYSEHLASRSSRCWLTMVAASVRFPAPSFVRTEAT
jgi:hypothetical protein